MIHHDWPIMYAHTHVHNIRDVWLNTHTYMASAEYTVRALLKGIRIGVNGFAGAHNKTVGVGGNCPDIIEQPVDANYKE